MKHTAQKSVLMTDMDSRGRLKLSSALALCQELATEQSTLMKVDNASMAGSYGWVLSRIYIEVVEVLTTPGNVELLTYPCLSRGVSYPRQYIISQRGKTFYRVNSDWTVIDMDSRRIVRADELPSYAEYCEDGILELMQASKVRANQVGMELGGNLTVGRSMIDVLGHVNNTKYMDIITDYLTDEQYRQEIASVNITYIKEGLLGENLNIYTKSDEQGLLMLGVKADGESCFAARAMWKVE